MANIKRPYLDNNCYYGDQASEMSNPNQASEMSNSHQTSEFSNPKFNA